MKTILKENLKQLISSAKVPLLVATSIVLLVIAAVHIASFLVTLQFNAFINYLNN